MTTETEKIVESTPEVATQEQSKTTPQEQIKANTPAPELIPKAPVEKITPLEEKFTTGDTLLDSSLDLLRATTSCTEGEIRQIAGKAFETGNPEDIDEGFIARRFGEKSKEVRTLAKAVVEHQKAVANQAVETAHTLAGGKDAWDNTVAIYKQSAPDYIQDTVQTMIDKGKSTEAIKFVMDYVKNSGAVAVQGTQIQGSTNNAGNPLSAAEFKQEILKLQEEAGNRSMDHGTHREKWDALVHRRELGKQRGI